MHLLTLPALQNSLLTQCYNPMLATVADSLDITAVCQAAEALARRDSITDRNYSSYHEVRCCVINLDLTWCN